MDTRGTFDAIFARLGWTYDKGDELFKDRDGQLIDPENILAVLPPDSTWDDLADYEWWVIHGKPQTPWFTCCMFAGAAAGHVPKGRTKFDSQSSIRWAKRFQLNLEVVACLAELQLLVC